MGPPTPGGARIESGQSPAPRSVHGVSGYNRPGNGEPAYSRYATCDKNGGGENASYLDLYLVSCWDKAEGAAAATVSIIIVLLSGNSYQY